MNTLDILQSLQLSNGLSISILDHTRVYFGDYYLVKLEIIFAVDALAAERIFSEVGSSAIAEINYSRFLVRMGVPSSQIDSVKKELIKDFETNSFPYLSSQEFPKRLLERQLIAAKAPARCFLGATS